MKKILLSAIIFLSLCFNQIYGQRVCASTFNPEEVQQTDYPRYQRYLELEQHILNYKNSVNGGMQQGRLINPNSTIIVPVVVHVIHTPGEAIGVGRNISDAQVQSQIDVLNEDFRRLNGDRINTPNAFLGVSSDPNFEFRLACLDPNGNPTNGITRTPSTVTAFTANDNIKFNSTGGHDAWLTSQFLNIWVGNLAGGLLGYAQFPFDYATKPNTDGVVIRTTALGRVGNVIAPFNTGRTATHEVGHWLDLFHIWGDDGNSCNGSDQCDDTPNQADENIGCPPFPSPSCSNNGDMSMNYMDFSDDACMNIYTLDQSIRMRAIFATGGPRAAFINNYFRINTPIALVCNTSTVTVLNPNCLPVTWTVVSGPATIIGGQGTNVVTLQRNGDGIALIRATAGGYIDEQNVIVGSPIPTIQYVTYYGNEVGLTALYIPNATYNWYEAGVLMESGVDNQYITFVACNTSKSISVEAVNNCGTSTKAFKGVSVRCSGGSTYSLSPNPASSELTISTTATGTTDDIKEVRVIDKAGTIKLSHKYGAGLKRVNINVSTLPTDMYIVQIFNGKEWQNQQLIINR